MRIFAYLLMIIVVLLGVSFACLNAEAVSVNVYLANFSLPLSMLLVFVLGLGILIGFSMAMINVIKLKAENRRINNRVRWAETEVQNLRQIPLKNQH